MKLIDLTNRRFGTLTAVQHHSHRTEDGRAVSTWLCRCDCGVEKSIAAINLIQGRVKTCATVGCRFRAQLKQRVEKLFAGRQHIFATYKRKALDEGRDFTLTLDLFAELIEANCYYCGNPPQNRSRRGQQNGQPYLYNGVDRIDSQRGYTIDNVRPCCWICNRMKHVLSEREFLTHIARVLEYSAKRLAA